MFIDLTACCGVGKELDKATLDAIPYSPETKVSNQEGVWMKSNSKWFCIKSKISNDVESQIAFIRDIYSSGIAILKVNNAPSGSTYEWIYNGSKNSTTTATFTVSGNYHGAYIVNVTYPKNGTKYTISHTFYV